MGLIELHTPEGVPWTIFVVALAIVIAPRLAEAIRLPGLVGLILAGFVVGPHVLDTVDVGTLDSLGEIGLLFLMFMAGLELDMVLFNRYRTAAVTFGGLTFLFPFAAGAAAATLLDYDTAAAILIGSIWASHTLVAYPLLRKLDVVDNPAVATTVGATVITDTAALVVLAIVVGAESGDESGIDIALQVGLGLALLVAATFLVLPWVSRLFFTTIGQERSLRFVWLVAALMGAASLAEVVEIEAIVGAFFAGIALNRLVPNRSGLMERTEFFASAFFIPMFLVSVGDLIDPEVVADIDTLALAAVFLAAVVVGKYAAAYVAGRRFQFTMDEVGAMFSLSVAQAAATLAATIVGYEAGILDEEFLNAAIVVVTASLFIASIAASYFGNRMPTSTTSERRLGDVVMIPVLPDVPFEPFLRLGSAIAAADGGIVLPVRAVEAELTADERRALASEIRVTAEAMGIDCEPVVRIDNSFADGVRSAAVQYEGTAVVMPSIPAPVFPTLFGSDETAGLARSLPIPVAVLSPAASSEATARVIVLLDETDLGATRTSSRHSALEFARHIARSGRPLVVAAPRPLHVDEVAEDVTQQKTEPGAVAWARSNATPGDLFILAARAERAAFSRSARLIAAIPGVSVALVSPASRGYSATEDTEYATRVVVGRTG